MGALSLRWRQVGKDQEQDSRPPVPSVWLNHMTASRWELGRGRGYYEYLFWTGEWKSWTNCMVTSELQGICAKLYICTSYKYTSIAFLVSTLRSALVLWPWVVVCRSLVTSRQSVDFKVLLLDFNTAYIGHITPRRPPEVILLAYGRELEFNGYKEASLSPLITPPIIGNTVFYHHCKPQHHFRRLATSVVDC